MVFIHCGFWNGILVDFVGQPEVAMIHHFSPVKQRKAESVTILHRIDQNQS